MRNLVTLSPVRAHRHDRLLGARRRLLHQPRRLQLSLGLGNGPGRRLGDLQAVSPNFNTMGIDLKDPPKSLVLTMPGSANPPDGHPVVVFPSSNAVDYQKILTWIEQGAQLN
jgi:hypothetical protein